MQAIPDLVCPECNKNFQSASALLQHFALQQKLNDLQRYYDDKKPLTSKKIPDLYPISHLKSKFKRTKESDVEGDSGIEDMNPMKFLVVTMANAEEKELSSAFVHSKIRKFQCEYCAKRFFSKSDAKRHKLTHTGQKSFECNTCNLSFNRKYLLRNHEIKFHTKDDENAIGTIETK